MLTKVGRCYFLSSGWPVVVLGDNLPGYPVDDDNAVVVIVH